MQKNTSKIFCVTARRGILFCWNTINYKSVAVKYSEKYSDLRGMKYIGKLWSTLEAEIGCEDKKCLDRVK
jgi:hypothetical protein